ncbi:MAG: hypothetical protein MI923_22480 [Phycisphaerales bacterium]|nr:hypothetical protein [Phycisphaerales bacterium]
MLPPWPPFYRTDEPTPTQTDIFLGMRSSHRQIRSILLTCGAAPGDYSSCGATATICKPGSSCPSVHRVTQPCCTNGGGTPNH